MGRGVEGERFRPVKGGVADGALPQFRSITQDVQEVDFEEAAVGGGGGGAVQSLQPGAEETVVAKVGHSVGEEDVGELAGVRGMGDLGDILPDVGGEADDASLFQAGEPFPDTEGKGEPSKKIQGAAEPLSALPGIWSDSPEFSLLPGEEGSDDVRFPVLHDLEYDRFNITASHGLCVTHRRNPCPRSPAS